MENPRQSADTNVPHCRAVARHWPLRRLSLRLAVVAGRILRLAVLFRKEDMRWLLVRPDDVADLQVGKVAAPVRVEVALAQLGRRQRRTRQQPLLLGELLRLEQPSHREPGVVHGGDLATRLLNGLDGQLRCVLHLDVDWEIECLVASGEQLDAGVAPPDGEKPALKEVADRQRAICRQ
eukprot:6184868-Pleurochrysis_carterae.AAC.3